MACRLDPSVSAGARQCACDPLSLFQPPLPWHAKCIQLSGLEQAKLLEELASVDLTTITGLAGALGVLFLAVFLGGDPGLFLDLPSLLLVLGGTAFVVMIKFGAPQLLGALEVAAQAFVYRPEDPARVIARLLELAGLTRHGGLQTLRNQASPNRFMAEGLKLVAEGHAPELLHQTLEKDRLLTLERHEWGQRIILAIAEAAPAMGLVGTLVGLVQMLGNLGDPRSLGPGMAIALLSTFYGVLLAHMVCYPLAEKLRLRAAQQSLMQSLVIDGLLAIQAGQSPRIMQDALQRYLPEGQRRVAPV
jgi:chemotaxis protein MotA